MSENQSETRALREALEKFQLNYDKDYTTELASCDTWIKWCEENDDSHGMNFHQGRQSAYISLDITMRSLLKSLSIISNKVATPASREGWREIKKGPPLIRVIWFSDVNEEPWITAVNGEINSAEMEAIEKQLTIDCAEECWGFENGFGTYTFQVSYFTEETEFCHGAPRVTNAAHWEFDMIDFQKEEVDPLPAAPDVEGGR